MLLWQCRQQPQTASVVGANEAVHLVVEIIPPPEAEHSATMMSLSSVVGMQIAKTSFLLLLLLVLDHQFLHPHLILPPASPAPPSARGIELLGYLENWGPDIKWWDENMPGNCLMGCFKAAPLIEQIKPYSAVNYGFVFLTTA